MSDMDWANISDATPSLSWPPQPSHNITNDEIERLSTELAAMRQQRDEAQRDAERYRWLKSRGCYWVEIQSQPHGEYIFKGIGNARMDEGIDYEIAALRKENTKTDINEVDINEVDITEANINNQSFRERKLD